MKTVKMVTLAGDERLPIGRCHPAQARKLVKMELAAWDDGSILLHLNPTYLQFMQQGYFWKTPAERTDVNISRGELARRREWFKLTMGKLPLALIGVGRSDLDHIIHTTAKMDGGAQSVYRGWAKRVPSREEANDEDYYLPVSDEFLLERDKSLAQIVESDLREFHNIALAESRSRGGVYDDTPPSEVAEALRAQEPPLLHEIMEQGLLWATAPDVWEHFGCRPVKGTPFPPDVQAELLEEVKDQKEHSKIVASGLGPCSFTKVQSGY